MTESEYFSIPDNPNSNPNKYTRPFDITFWVDDLSTLDIKYKDNQMTDKERIAELERVNKLLESRNKHWDEKFDTWLKITPDGKERLILDARITNQRGELKSLSQQIARLKSQLSAQAEENKILRWVLSTNTEVWSDWVSHDSNSHTPEYSDCYICNILAKHKSHYTALAEAKDKVVEVLKTLASDLKVHGEARELCEKMLPNVLKDLDGYVELANNALNELNKVKESK